MASARRRFLLFTRFLPLWKGRNTQVEVKGSGWCWNGSSFPVFTRYSSFPFCLRFLSFAPLPVAPFLAPPFPISPAPFRYQPATPPPLRLASFSRLDVSLVTRLDNNTLLYLLFSNSLLGRGFVYSSSVLIKSFWRPLVSTSRVSKIQTTTTRTDSQQQPSAGRFLLATSHDRSSQTSFFFVLSSYTETLSSFPSILPALVFEDVDPTSESVSTPEPRRRGSMKRGET